MNAYSRCYTLYIHLSNGPWSLGVHCGVWASCVGVLARQLSLHVLCIVCCVQRLNIDTLEPVCVCVLQMYHSLNDQLGWSLRNTSGVRHVSFSAGSAPLSCFLAISAHSGSRGRLSFLRPRSPPSLGAAPVEYRLHRSQLAEAQGLTRRRERR